MELCSHNWMRPESLDVTFKRLLDCGYDSIELSGLPDDSEYQLVNVKRLMKDQLPKAQGSPQAG